MATSFCHDLDLVYFIFPFKIFTSLLFDVAVMRVLLGRLFQCEQFSVIPDSWCGESAVKWHFGVPAFPVASLRYHNSRRHFPMQGHVTSWHYHFQAGPGSWR